MADEIKKDDLNKQNPLGVNQPIRRPGANAGPQGTGFTNIQRVIGASQGNKLGSAVSSGVQQVGQNVKQNIAQSGQKFQQGVQGSQLGTSGNIQQSGSLIDKAMAGPQNLSEQDLKQAEQFRRGDYKGPMELENAAQLAGQGVEAETLGRLGSSAGGRQGLLQRFVGAPQYSAGQQKLDTLLLGGNKEALSGIRGSVRGLGDESIRAVETSRGQAEQQAGLNKQFGQDFLGRITGKNKDIDAATQAAYDQAVTDEGKYKSSFDSAINELNKPSGWSPRSGNYGPNINKAIEMAPLSPEKKNELFSIANQAKAAGLNPAKAVAKFMEFNGPQQLKDKSSLLSQEQVASMQALGKLAGSDTSGIQAGSYKKGSADANTAGLSSIIKSTLGAGSPADPTEASISGINSVEILKNAVTSPSKAFYENPGVRAALLNPQEMAEYNAAAASLDAANKMDASRGIANKKSQTVENAQNAARIRLSNLQKIFEDRARRNLPRAEENKNAIASAKTRFNTGDF